MSEWDGYADEWDQNHDARAYSQKAFASLLKRFNPGESAWQKLRVLDFGAGTGLLTEKLAPLVNEVVAVDSSIKMIEVLSRKHLENVRTETKELDLEAVQSHTLFTDRFDLIVASSVCSFLPNFGAFLTIVKALLSPTGTFFQWDWEKQNEDQPFSFTRDAILTAYREADLNPVFVGREFSAKGPKGDLPVLVGVAELL